MAILYSNSTGNFTSASTWSVVEPNTFIPAIATQETGTTTSTTSFVSSTIFSFVSGAPTLDGLALKISTRAASPVGTFSVRIFNSTAASAVAGTTVTINVADMIVSAGGWFFFKFSAPVALANATNYTVQLTTSSNAQVTTYRKSATAGDWTFALRTTTTQAPAAGDSMIIGGEWISAGVNNTFTITMDNTASTQFGSGTTGTAAISISSNGILTWGTAASTNYVLNIAGSLYLNNGSTYSQGTLATPIPSTSTAKLNIVQASNVQFGIEAQAGSTFNTGGTPITNSALLAADAAASATSLTTNISTGWKNGDVIALASTTRTRTEAESKALTANAVGTNLTITALTNAHSGTSPTQGELINLTRNVSIFGTNTSLQAYINIQTTAIVDLEATEFYFMGSNTANKRGIDIGTTISGSCTINNCSMHDFQVTGSLAANVNAGTSNNVMITNTVVYNIASSGIVIAATSVGTNNMLNNIIVIAAGTNAAANGISINDLAGTYTNLTGTSCQGPGITLQDNTATKTNVFGTINNLTAHSNSTIGISFANVTGVTNNPMGTFSNLTAWRNGSNGINLSNSFTIMIDTVSVFGNATANITVGGTECDNIYLKSVTANAGTTLTCPIGVNITTDCHEIYFDTSTFGATTTHATGDVNISSTNFFPRLTLRNCLLNSATPVANSTNMTEGGFVRLAKFQQTSGNHKTFFKYGTVTSDTTIYNSGPVSARLTPNNAASTDKLQDGIKKIAVPNGQTATIKVFLRKSVVGDGSAYNGNQPRLMLKADPAAGVTSDTVLATADNTYNGVFKALSATTPAITDNAVFQVYIDCDGTAGWINIDDWSCS